MPPRLKTPFVSGPGKALVAVLIGWMGMMGSARAQAAWPGEPWKSSTNLTSLASSDWQTNLSGAFWNPIKRQLWVVNNSGMFYKLVEGGPLGLMIDTTGGRPARWNCGGDAEGITQAGLDDNSVFVMNEDGYIEEYSTVGNGTVKKLHGWDIRSVAGPVDGSGPEGIAFIPDEWLAAQGFTDRVGKKYTSVNGMSGLFFVAHQDGGLIHVFDCKRNDNSCLHVGTYATGRDESSDLAFDRSIGALYIWHNTGSNSLEATRLSSRGSGGGSRTLVTLKEFAGPKSGNLEGVAITPASTGEGWYFAADDDNQDGHALMWFREFKPGIFKTDFGISKTSACIGEPILITDSSIGLAGTEAYSWSFGADGVGGVSNRAGPHTLRYASIGVKIVQSRITGAIADTMTRTIEISGCATSLPNQSPNRSPASSSASPTSRFTSTGVSRGSAGLLAGYAGADGTTSLFTLTGRNRPGLTANVTRSFPQSFQQLDLE